MTTDTAIPFKFPEGLKVITSAKPEYHKRPKWDRYGIPMIVYEFEPADIRSRPFNVVFRDGSDRVYHGHGVRRTANNTLTIVWAPHEPESVRVILAADAVAAIYDGDQPDAPLAAISE